MNDARAATLETTTLEERWQSLLAVLESIGAHRALPDLLDEVARRLGPLVGCDTVLLMVHEGDEEVVTLHLLGGKPAGFTPKAKCPDGESISKTVVRTQEPVFVASTRTDSRGTACTKLLAEHGLLAYWTYPLTTSRRRLGAIGFCAPREGLPGAEEQVVLARVANLVALAVENSLNQDQVRAERDRLQLLLDVNAAVASHLDLRALVEATATCLRRFMRFEYTSLGLYDEDDDTLEVHALSFQDGKGHMKEGATYPTDDSPAGRAVRTRQPWVGSTAADLEAYDTEVTRALLADGIRSGVCVPLVSRGEILGVLNACSLREHAFSPADVALLAQVANQIAPAVENACAYCQIRSLKDKLTREKVYLEAELQHDFQDIVGASGALSQVLDAVKTVAPTDSTVLIWGETGTGKELIARAIHEASGRKKGTFVKLNCAAIPTGLLESELFGHEKGAFTGALAQRIGRFELADGGTLFLDEVGDIPPELQPKLLRVLQEREFERLGGNKTIHVDVRLVAATNRDLAEMVAERTFRSDLYYRLNVFPVSLPPLRERRDDIPLLVRHFVQRCAQRMKKRVETIPEEALAALSRYDWPGNVRELENFIERAVILTRGSALEAPLSELRPRNGGHHPAPAPASAPRAAESPQTLADAERAHILAALEETGWVVGGAKGAAARLGMSRTTLQAKMERLGIKRPT
jgi:formate hydrogenlyase transcriptional activator